MKIDSGYPIQVNQATLGGKGARELTRPVSSYSDSVTLSNGLETVRTLSGYDAMEEANTLLSDQIGQMQSRFAKLFATVHSEVPTSL